MSAQPTALFLADVLANDPLSRVHHHRAADELRRLHDDYENALKHFAEAVEGYKQMAAQRDALLAALHSISLAAQDSGSTREGMGLYARAAIAKAEGSNDKD